MRKRLSRIIVALAATLIALFLVGCGETSPSRVIVLKAESNRIVYELGDPLDLTVNAKYSDGSKADISDFEVTGYDENLLGPQTITVSFGGKSV